MKQVCRLICLVLTVVSFLTAGDPTSAGDAEDLGLIGREARINAQRLPGRADLAMARHGLAGTLAAANAKKEAPAKGSDPTAGCCPAEVNVALDYVRGGSK